MAATFKGEKPPITNPDSGSQRALGHQANNGIFVSKSDDGGASWQTPVAVASHLYDGEPQGTVRHHARFGDRHLPLSARVGDGTTPNPNYGNMYEVWARFYPLGQYPGDPNVYSAAATS